jgi:hypothetical protein
VRRCIESGRLDHNRDEETKAHMLADIEADQIKVVNAMFELYPGLYRKYSMAAGASWTRAT